MTALGDPAPRRRGWLDSKKSTQGVHDLVAAAFRNLHQCNVLRAGEEGLFMWAAGTEAARAPHAIMGMTPVWGRCWVSGGLAYPQRLCTVDTEYFMNCCISYVRSEDQD